MVNRKRKGVFRTKHKIWGTAVYAKRRPDGTFLDIQSIKRAMVHERLQHAKKVVKSGYGFRGDTK
ncbi:MAG TPA: hypothetical protein VK675_01465 [Candidatus Paceibacterota bacterium]|nr:hypothetical protein [Candidatus Paceibacterota bacterium]